MTERKRLAILITGGNLNNHKGLMNACLSRARYLMQCATEYDIDVYTLQEEEREFRPHNILFHDNCYETIEIDGMKIRVLWKIVYRAKRFYRKGLKTYYNRTKSNFLDVGWQKQYARYFREYDLLSVHSFNGGIIAMEVKRRYGIPYFITWHGSDIHTHPWERPWVKQPTIDIIEKATTNFFVSKALCKESERLTKEGCKEVLYNGIDASLFYRFSDEKRTEFRERFGVNRKKVVAFAGNLFDIKNAALLPDIFANVAEGYSEPVEFWIIGDGSLRRHIEERISQLKIPCRMWGNQPVETMPELYNSIDVLVLPSKNEGLPLVVIEAAACGASVVGSRVGGIPEAIGVDNTVELGGQFVCNMSKLIVAKLLTPSKLSVNDMFDWKKTAYMEDFFTNKKLNNLK